MVSGVGETKLQQYSERFLQVIADFCNVSIAADAVEGIDKAVSLVFPDSKILERVQLSEQPISISTLTSVINEVIKEQGCSSLTAVRVSDWLVSEGYLQVMDQNGKRTKVPTSKGTLFGITQEERTGSSDKYFVNLYSLAVQQFIVEHVHDIMLLDKK
jgi:hypothetical protein